MEKNVVTILLNDLFLGFFNTEKLEFTLIIYSSYTRNYTYEQRKN